MHYFLSPWNEDRGDENSDWGKSLWYFEADDDGNVIRQVEAYENGKVLKYDKQTPHDDYGGLATHSIDVGEFQPYLIPEGEFQDRWDFPLDYTVRHVHKDGRISWRRGEEEE